MEMKKELLQQDELLAVQNKLSSEVDDVTHQDKQIGLTSSYIDYKVDAAINSVLQ